MLRLNRSMMILVFAACSLAACGGGNQEQSGHQFPPSEAHAAQYPERVKQLGETFDQETPQADDAISKFETYPGELSETDWAMVSKIIKKADEVGRSEDMHELLEKHKSVDGFLDENLDDLSRRIGRNIDAEAKKTGAKKFEARSSIRYSLPKVAKQQFEEEMRANNEAHQIIEAQKDTLKKSNVKKLEDQVDAITLTAHFVYVTAPEAKAELDQQVSDSESVRKTLDEGIKNRETAMNAEGVTESEKTFHGKKLEMLKTSRGELDTSIQSAKERQKTFGDQVDKLQERYEKSFKALTEDLDKRAEAQKPQPE